MGLLLRSMTTSVSGISAVGQLRQGPLRLLEFAEKHPVFRLHPLEFALEFGVDAHGQLRSGRHGLVVAGADILEFPFQLFALGADLVLFLRRDLLELAQAISPLLPVVIDDFIPYRRPRRR